MSIIGVSLQRLMSQVYTLGWNCWDGIAGMEFSQSLQDSVESACYQLITPTNSGAELLYSIFFPTLDIVIRFQF